MAVQVQRQDSQTLRISGEITFHSVLQLRRLLEAELAQAAGELTLDLSGVTAADSSALSLWLCIRRQADRRGLRLYALNVPEKLHALSRLVGLEREWTEALPVDQALPA
ncbi:STAS domain-containing protein [Marinobacterium arenosum]|uniref:STAS domain-containing protein n=1 Tax=Marinobacterium arenosum TaxID=2862496 RepID=UPI001C96B07E|nr:STAS domain-containing protein [Marinobacterium arenosum]MBY4676772.1 STAS domain-containing protein [Marinobacterium arenosum]